MQQPPSQRLAYSIMDEAARTSICQEVLQYHAADEAFCQVYSQHQTLIASPDNQLIRPVSNSTTTTTAVKRGNVVRPKLIDVVNFPLIIPLQITQLQEILWQLHLQQNQAYKINLMLPAIFRYVGNTDFSENIEVDDGKQPLTDEESVTADDLYRYGYGSNNSFLLHKEGPFLISDRASFQAFIEHAVTAERIVEEVANMRYSTKCF